MKWMRAWMQKWRVSRLRKVSGAIGILLLLLAWGIEKYLSQIDAQLGLVRQMRGELEIHCRHDRLLDVQQAVAEQLYAIQAEMHFSSYPSDLTAVQRAVRQEIYHCQHLIDLYGQYLAAINSRQDWVETFPYRVGIVAYGPDQRERERRYLSRRGGTT